MWFDWFINLFKTPPPAKTGAGRVPPSAKKVAAKVPESSARGRSISLQSLVNTAGRINYVALQNFASKFGKEVFITQLPHPSLMGQELAKGRFLTRRTKAASMDQTCTFLTAEAPPSRGALKEPPEPDSMGSAIYVLLKDSGNPAHFTIGRTSDNDLTFNDNSVSKEHAEIVISDGRYLLRDLQSTNGTALNGMSVKNQEVELQPWDELKLGRLTFLFLAPADLYDKLMEME